MHYTTFRSLVRQKGWSLAQLRCDVRPPQALLDFMTLLGLECYEHYVHRLERQERREMAALSRQMDAIENLHERF